MATGFAVALLWALGPMDQVEAATGIRIYNLPLAFLAALLVNLVVSLLRPRRAARDGR
jgi:hypothetical protein